MLWACSASGDSVAGLSSLDEELRDLALDSDTEEAAGTSDNQGTTTSDEEDLSVIVVEPDTIVLSGRQQGALTFSLTTVCCGALVMIPRHLGCMG